MKASILGVPLDLGAENLGVDIGPDAFRHQKIIDKLEKSGFEITDLGNVKCSLRDQLEVGEKKLKYLSEIVRVCQESARIADSAIKKGEKLIALGGDHSINLGVFSGVSQALDGQIGLIYLDQHGDINTDETTLTGNIHGMHLSALMGFGDERLVNVYSKKVKLDKKNLVHIGGSDFDKAEMDLIKNEQLITFTMLDLLSHGLSPLFPLIKDLQKRAKNIWVSMDFDAIDSVYAPGAGMPNKGGLSYREITAIADFIGQNCNVVGVDLVEYNPLTDIEGKTAELGIELIAKFLGSNYSWYTNYLEHNKI